MSYWLQLIGLWQRFKTFFSVDRSNESVEMSMALQQTDYKQAIDELTQAEDALTLRRIFTSNPVLLQPEIDQYLTKKIEEAWAQEQHQEQLSAVGNLLACRTFLANCLQQGIERVLRQPLPLPLGQQSALGQLYLTYEPPDFPRRATLLRAVLNEVRRTTEPDLWATLQRELADCLVLQVGSDRAKQLEEALERHRLALAVWLEPPFVGSLKWGQALHATAATLFRRIKGRKADNLQQAIRLYEQALTVRTKEELPAAWAETQHELGKTWFAMPAADRKGTIEKALHHFEAALSVRTRAQAADHWASTTHELALAWSAYPGNNRRENIEKAITLCHAVQEVFTEVKQPTAWGRSQVALANAYLLRLQGDRTDNIERAITAYQNAVRVFVNSSVEHALACHNLASTYRQRTLEDKRANLAQALRYHAEALQVYNKNSYPLEWAHVLVGLGTVYCQPDAPGGRAENLERAIGFYQQALSVRTEDQDPAGWATIQNDLGNAYADRLVGPRSDNQNKAIACYENALKQRTRQLSPEHWAETVNNLGAIYSERLAGNPLQNQQQAVAYLRQALAVHTPDLFPHDARRAARNLAHLLFIQGEWRAAADAYAQAILATDYLFLAGAMPKARQVEVREARDLAAHAAYALVRAGRFAQAVETAEAGRTRMLAETLARNEAALEGATAPDRHDFDTARARIATLEAEARAEDGASSRAFITISADLRQARADLSAITDRIRAYIPEFMPQALSFEAIRTTVTASGQPVVYLMTTSAGTVGLILFPNQQQFNEDALLWQDHFSTHDLEQILRGEADGPGYLQEITADHTERLKAFLARLQPTLATALLAPLVARLQTLGYNQATLIPMGLLTLLPLHVATVKSVTFAYAPSVRGLQSALHAAQKRRSLPPNLLGIANPLPNPRPLSFARIQIEEASIFFPANAQTTLYEYQATQTRIAAALSGVTYLHFACHGRFDMNESLASVLSLADNDDLTLRDLFNGALDLTSVQLVILSACQTGITDVRQAPDEAVGFPAAFLQAGVPGVLSTLWSVDSLSTALLMAKFYHYHLGCGLTPAIALHRSQEWLCRVTSAELASYFEQRHQKLGRRDRHVFKEMRYYQTRPPTEQPFAHPYYWAGFTFAGV